MRADVPVVETSGHGELPVGALGYLQRTIVALLRPAPEPVLGVRIRLTRLPDPAVTHPMVAQANVDLGGRLLRVQVTAGTAAEAADLLAARLRRRLEQAHTDRYRHSRGEGRDAPGTQQGPGARVSRRKSYRLATCSVDEALAEMEGCDYDFHLFTEAGSGQDSVLYRDVAGPRLAQLHPQPDQVAPHTATVSISGHPAPPLTTEQAIDRLGLSGLPFLFYRDEDSHRGHLLYRRYDGRYGVIAPAG
ncbi:sigma 54 modulation/S30EA ribosomal C-terminal domain-containing protein [Pseudonocardia acidicola]|uniref:sigma 54 modulation/S30EA ribosomal C-terminal domain-containing protein n=1 Tax=Pseudonocardia acidicola TaxID=2724939 RepID=UPI00308404C3